MAALLPQLLRKHRLCLKAEWERRLRAEPAITAMAHPDILVYMMDETLDQLGALLRAKSAERWGAVQHSHLMQLRALCPCGLNPLLTYFVTGGDAMQAVLLEVAAELPEVEKHALCSAWHFMAQNEIESLCAPCHRICAPGLNVRLDTQMGSG